MNILAGAATTALALSSISGTFAQEAGQIHISVPVCEEGQEAVITMTMLNPNEAENVRPYNLLAALPTFEIDCMPAKEVEAMRPITGNFGDSLPLQINGSTSRPN
jgi:hypothetical protein